MKTAQSQMHFSWHEALAADVAALGGRKKLAPQLWPSEDEETAQSRLKAALSPGHAQELKPPVVMKIKHLARAVGSDALVRYEAQELGFRVEWINPVDEEKQLDREIRDLLQVVLKKQEARERAAQRAEAQAVPR